MKKTIGVEVCVCGICGREQTLLEALEGELKVCYVCGKHLCHKCYAYVNIPDKKGYKNYVVCPSHLPELPK